MLENDLHFQLYHTNREEEQKWHMKSRQLWLQGRDNNSNFFHKQATVRKIQNNISSITDVDENLHSDKESIKMVAFAHFQDLLTKMRSDEDYSDFL